LGPFSPMPDYLSPFKYKQPHNIKGKLMALKKMPDFKEFQEKILNKIIFELGAQNHSKTYPLFEKVGILNMPV
jgi:hypothetical protein